MILQDHINSITQDAILWLCAKHWRKATNAIDQQIATNAIVELLASIRAEIKRDTYVKKVCDELAKLNEDADRRKAISIKDYKTLERKLNKANDDERSEILPLMDEASKKLATIDKEILPELSVKDLTRYVKAAVDVKEKEIKEKQTLYYCTETWVQF